MESENSAFLASAVAHKWLGTVLGLLDIQSVPTPICSDAHLTLASSLRSCMCVGCVRICTTACPRCF